MKIAIAQIPVVEEIGKNLKEITAAVEYAKDVKADILLTPEGSLSGYSHIFDRKEAGEALKEICAFAKKSHVGLALGTCWDDDDGKCYDGIRFYLPDGLYLGCSAKQLLCGTLDDEPIGEINHYAVMQPRVFDYMGTVIGGLVCNDMWANPSVTPMSDTYPARILAKMGAKVIFHAVNGGRDESKFSQETVKLFHEAHILVQSAAYNLTIVSVDNAEPLDIGVASKGGFAARGEWLFTLPDKGRQYGCLAI
ncbi:MAG: carbon-nitrogen hydrolase family protein [Oscillospiraceae bacterium]|nr:carbon-nitrogen hydrolase family protein [Oscillospiraceae bacterium]